MQGIRLTDGPNNLSGWVRILYYNRWGAVSRDEEWDLNDARVVCRQLGYDNATRISWDYSWKESAVVWMRDVQCRGNETSILSCRHERYQYNNFRTGTNAGVVCEVLNLLGAIKQLKEEVGCCRQRVTNGGIKDIWRKYGYVTLNEINKGMMVQQPCRVKQAAFLLDYYHCASHSLNLVASQTVKVHCQAVLLR
ncbi:Galectin-3-binding protein [Holothuria leucospilota]|uniref:Galectin-3-binding protein n=1 Tax=Holothuria leucospilota TaxID=206669 RepID=A0A9Q1BTN7_HOLLE|nr:Galectin-3-binding protein [Holothuria leucospilota]